MLIQILNDSHAFVKLSHTIPIYTCITRVNEHKRSVVFFKQTKFSLFVFVFSILNMILWICLWPARPFVKWLYESLSWTNFCIKTLLRMGRIYDMWMKTHQCHSVVSMWFECDSCCYICCYCEARKRVITRVTVFHILIDACVWVHVYGL